MKNFKVGQKVVCKPGPDYNVKITFYKDGSREVGCTDPTESPKDGEVVTVHSVPDCEGYMSLSEYLTCKDGSPQVFHSSHFQPLIQYPDAKKEIIKNMQVITETSDQPIKEYSFN